MIEKLVLAYLKSQAKDIIRFWALAISLGADPDGKLALAALEFVVQHGKPEAAAVEKWLRKKKFIT